MDMAHSPRFRLPQHPCGLPHAPAMLRAESPSSAAANDLVTAMMAHYATRRFNGILKRMRSGVYGGQQRRLEWHIPITVYTVRSQHGVILDADAQRGSRGSGGGPG
jgi:hypothetical protein